MVYGTHVIVINRDRLQSFGKSGYITGFDDNIQPGIRYAVVQINNEEYCFNISDLLPLNSAI